MAQRAPIVTWLDNVGVERQRRFSAPLTASRPLHMEAFHKNDLAAP